MKKIVARLVMLLFVMGVILPQTAQAKKRPFVFDENTNWFYIVSDKGEHLFWNAEFDIVEITNNCANTHSYHWTCDGEGHIYNRAKGADATLSGKVKLGRLIIDTPAQLSKQGGAVLQNGHICDSSMSTTLYAYSTPNILQFSEDTKTIFTTHAIEIPIMPINFEESIKVEAKNKIQTIEESLKPMKALLPDTYTPSIPTEDISISGNGYLDLVVEWSRSSKKGDIIDDGGYTIPLEKNLVNYVDGYYVTTTFGVGSPKYLEHPFEGYGDPFQSCIGRSMAHCSYKISRNKWIITRKEQIQVDCGFDEQGHPTSPDKDCPDYKRLKTGTYKITYELFGVEIPATITCTRKMYQTPRTNRLTSGGGHYSHAFLGTEADPYAPWRIVQNMVVEIDINEFIKKKGFTNKKIAYLDLLNEGARVDSDFFDYGDRAVSIAILKTYYKELISLSYDDIERRWKQKQFKSALSDAILIGYWDLAELICEELFTSCKNVDELLDTFTSVFSCIYNKPPRNEDFPHLAFDGLMGTYSYNHFTDGVSKDLFTEYLEKRKEFFADFSKISINNEKYNAAFYTFLKIMRANTYKEDFYKQIYSCPNQQFVAESRDFLAKDALWNLYILQDNYLKDRNITAMIKGCYLCKKMVDAECLPDSEESRHAMKNIYNLVMGFLCDHFNKFDNCWRNAPMELDEVAEQIKIILDLHYNHAHLSLLSPELEHRCKQRIESYNLLKTHDVAKFRQYIQEWGYNNMYVHNLEQLYKEELQY